MKNSLLLCLLFSLGLNTLLKAQSSDRDKFLEALYLMDEKRYSDAQPLLENLVSQQPNNANLNFNMGLAMSNSHLKEDQEKALGYFQKSIAGVSPKYTPYSRKEKNAPVDAHYYYGLALHSDMQFDKAIQNFRKFQGYINDKHYLFEEVKNRIKMSEYAKEAVKEPRNVEFNNLGKRLNSKYPDYSPAIRIDESAIYFTSRRLRPDGSNKDLIDPIDGQYFEDIYISFNDDGQWSEPRQLNISTDGNEATLSLSADGKTLFIYKGDNNNGALYESKLKGDSAGYEQWSTPALLGSNINDPKANETHVSIAPSGEMLYFTSDREGGSGAMDIYFCRKLPNGEWADAVNIGPTINTRFNEDGVFIHPDGKTLYFSSEGHPSMGGYDIFSSSLTEKGWSKPANLGYPVNSLENDIFFATTPDGKRAYYSSLKEDGFGATDIYQLKLIDAEETPLTLYRGKFIYANSSRPPAGAQVTVIGNSNGEMVGVYSPRQRDGEFSVILEPNQSYHIFYEADGFETYEEDIFVPEGSSYQEIYKDIKLKPVEVESSEELPNDSSNEMPKENSKTKGPSPSRKSSKLGAKPVFNGAVISGVEVKLLDENGNLIETESTQDDGSFTFKRLQPDNTYNIAFVGESPDDNTLVFTNEQGEKFTFMKLREGVYQYLPNPKKSPEKAPVKTYTVSVSDEKAFKDTYPQPEELKDVIVYFQKYFPYNATDINLNNRDFKSFIKDVAEVVEKKGFAQIIITSSASKVPTRSYEGNKELTRKRAYATKDMLVKVLKDNGLSEDQYNFVDINTLITGPEYKNDASSNRSLYEKYQYVRIFIK